MMSDKEFYFYNVFLDNSMRGDRYCIKLIDGTTLKGVPRSGSFLDPNGPNRTFLLELSDSVQEIHFRDVVCAKKIE